MKMTMGILACLTLWFTPIAHAQSESGASPFDHSKTGFVLRDVHTTLRCEQCHVDAIFKNTPKNCAGCHSIGSRVGATPKPVHHVLTTNSCDTCHVSATSFLVKSFKHAGITNGCSSCHNGQSLGVVSKQASHFPTLLPCENCHTNTNTFTSSRMDHTGITSRCLSCHGGQFAGVVSKPVAHIATTAPCETCHSSTITFLGSTFDHTAVVTGSCNDCHLGQNAGVVSQPAIHVPTFAAKCDACHTATNTSGYTSFLGAFYDHTTPVSANNCSSCHTGQFTGPLGKPSYHISTTVQCDTCHTSTNTISFTTFLGATIDHTAIGTATCASCHNGISAKGKPATHIFTSTDCVTCHTSGNTLMFTTFLGATYIHNPNPPTAGSCSNCHNGTNATGKPTFHIPTTAACDTCHTQTNTTNYTTFLGAVYIHVSPVGVCSTCHNGTSAKGKSATHVSTTATCDTCHTQMNTVGYTSFLGATYIHPSPPGVCSTCHNGATALGKSALHVATTATCDLCHTITNTVNYTSFLGATYIHLNPPGVCSTCHNGTTALGKPATHMVTTAACDSCHTQTNTSNYMTFLGATGAVDHSTIAAGTCATCHNGTTAKGKTATHIPVTISCDGCHQIYNGTTVTTFAPGTINHSLVTATTCFLCHNGSYTSQGTMGAQAMPINHIPTTITGGIGGLPCTTCHTNPGYTSPTGWLAVQMNHNGAQGGGVPIYCVNCHLTGTTYLVPSGFQWKSHNGSSTAKDCSSSGCHKPIGQTGSTYINWN